MNRRARNELEWTLHSNDLTLMELYKVKVTGWSRTEQNVCSKRWHTCTHQRGDGAATGRFQLRENASHLSQECVPKHWNSLQVDESADVPFGRFSLLKQYKSRRKETVGCGTVGCRSGESCVPVGGLAIQRHLWTHLSLLLYRILCAFKTQTQTFPPPSSSPLIRAVVCDQPERKFGRRQMQIPSIRGPSKITRIVRY